MSIDRGMEISEMRVVLQFIRKMNSTRATNMPPSTSDFFTLPIDPSMNLDWRNIPELTLTSEGRAALMSSSSLSSFLVSSSEFVLGCLVTVIMTAGFPSFDAMPRTGVFGPILTSAIASSGIGRPLGEVFTRAFFICSMSSVDRTPRTMYSFPYS